MGGSAFQLRPHFSSLYSLSYSVWSSSIKSAFYWSILVISPSLVQVILPVILWGMM